MRPTKRGISSIHVEEPVLYNDDARTHREHQPAEVSAPLYLSTYLLRISHHHNLVYSHSLATAAAAAAASLSPRRMASFLG